MKVHLAQLDEMRRMCANLSAQRQQAEELMQKVSNDFKAAEMNIRQNDQISPSQLEGMYTKLMTSLDSATAEINKLINRQRLDEEKKRLVEIEQQRAHEKAEQRALEEKVKREEDERRM